MKALLVASAALCLAALTVARPLEEEEEQSNNCLQRDLLEIILAEIKLTSETRDVESDHSGGYSQNFVSPPPPTYYLKQN